MANLSFKFNLSQRVAVTYIKLKAVTSKLQRTASSIGFIKKSLFHNVIPTFARVSGNFSNDNDKWHCSKRILLSELRKHQQKLTELIYEEREINSQLERKCGYKLCQILILKIKNVLLSERIDNITTKNKKLYRLIKATVNKTTYRVPLINLSDHELNNHEENQLRFGLEQSFVYKNKNQRKFLAANLETLSQKVDSCIPADKKEHFHEFLRGYTDIFINNVNKTTDYTYKNLRGLINDETTVVMKGDKDSSVVIMNRSDYTEKLESMIQDGIRNGTYQETIDTTLQDLKQFQSFLYRNFQTHKKYKEMIPSSNQPARLYATAKTHKFSNVNEISKDALTFRPIIDQTGTCTHKTAQIIGEYLRPLSKNEFTITDTQQFPEMIKALPLLSPNEEYVSYDVESLFTNIPLKETIEFILEEIYDNHKITPICSRLVFKRLLFKLTTECTFIFNKKFYRQTDGCAMGGPLSVIMADIWMVKVEREVVEPTKPKFYRRYVDDVINRRNISEHDSLFESLNNHHRNMNFTIEINPPKFLDTNIVINQGKVTSSVHRKVGKLPVHWSSETPKRYKRNAITGDLHRSTRISDDIVKETNLIKQKFINANFPKRFIESVVADFKHKQELNSRKGEDSLIIPPGFFDSKPLVLLVELPYCQLNEKASKTFQKRFEKFTNGKYNVIVKWLTRKVQTLFPLKDRMSHVSCKVYMGTCSCGEIYVGETKRNVETRWREHENPKFNSEPAKHLLNYPEHSFDWTVLSSASKNDRTRKNLEASFIAIIKPSLNEQVKHNILNLFRNGVT